MKTSKFKKFALIAASVMVLGATSQALATPQFTIRPSAIPGSAEPNFIADSIAGSSSELLNLTGNTANGSGWLQFSNFKLNGANLPQSATGIQTTYGLYVTFTLTDHLISGTAGQPGATYQLDTLNFQFFADPNFAFPATALTTTFNQATVSGNSFTQATVSGNGDDLLLASGSVIVGSAGFNAQGGVFLNSTQTFNVTALGQQFFFAPVPFFNMAFTEFNNTGPGLTFTTDGAHAAITNATGSVDFNRIPEPSSLALMGIALVGLGFSARRRKQ